MLRRKTTPKQIISTQQCRQMMSNKFNKFVNEHIINEQQQELVFNYSCALKRDELKQQSIKTQLTNRFFNSNKNKKKKYFLQEKLKINLDQNFQLRRRLSKQFKKTITGSKQLQSRSLRTVNLSTRYEQTLTPSKSMRRKISYSPSPWGRSKVYWSQIEDIIEEAHKVSSKPMRINRNLMTVTDKIKLVQDTYKFQKQQIIDKIIQKDVDNYFKFQGAVGNQINPEEKKKFFEEIKMKELTNFDKYNINFLSYMKQKTHTNIEKSIYNEKIRQKQNFVQKFQQFILTQFKFSQEAKRRLQKIFKAIEMEYKRLQKNKKVSERIVK